jgi:hypothetical protein
VRDLAPPVVTGSIAPRAEPAPGAPPQPVAAQPLPAQPMPPPVTVASKARDQDSRSDWDTVRRTVAKAAAKAPTERIVWTNDETGNSGTISDLIVSKSRTGSACKGFSTTLASIDGVRLYHGQVCDEGRGDWTYTSVEPADGKPPGG